MSGRLQKLFKRRLQVGTASWNADAQKIHSFFQWQRQTPSDQVNRGMIALFAQGCELGGAAVIDFLSFHARSFQESPEQLTERMGLCCLLSIWSFQFEPPCVGCYFNKMFDSLSTKLQNAFRNL